MSRQGPLDKKEIVAGRALPFAVYGADRKLLLAKGHVVTDRIREVLLRDGRVAVFEDGDGAGRNGDGLAEAETIAPLEALRRQYMGAASGARLGFRISRDERSDSYTCWAIGVHEPRRLILTAPTHTDGTFQTVTPGQPWLFRTFYATAAFRFTAIVQKVVFEPFAYFHVEVPPLVETRMVRQRPRAQVCLSAAANDSDALITDLSTEGVRLAFDESRQTQIGEQLALQFRLTILGHVHEIEAQATIATALGAVDQRHPKVRFYGARMQVPSPLDVIALQAYVQEKLVQELDGLRKILSSSAGEVLSG